MQIGRLGFNIILAANIALSITVGILIFQRPPHQDPTKNPSHIDSTELKMYEEHFYRLFPGKRYTGQIYFQPDLGDKAGVCYPLHAPPLFYTQIIISLKSWSKYSSYGKEELIIHELGHCLYGLDHDDSDVELTIEGVTEECPKTIMNSVTIGNTECYKYKRPYYINEFKSRIEEKDVNQTK